MAANRAVSFYVELPFVVDETTMADNAIQRLSDEWAGYEPDDGDPEVIQIEALAPMAANAARIASLMPSAALRAVGTKLLNVPYDPGSPAQTTVTFTVQDTAGYTVGAGDQFAIDGFAFAVFEDFNVAPSGTEASGCQVYSQGVPTAAANGLTGTTIAQLSLPPFVTAVSVDHPTAGGSDPMTDDEYQSKISRELRLRAKTIVTARDYELEALEFSDEIGRAMAIGDTAREVNVWVATLTGEPVSSPTKTALAAHYVQFQVVNNVNNFINDPDYNTIDVAWSAKGLATADPTATKAAVNAMLTSRLSPPNWGAPTQGDPGSPGATQWTNETVVRANELIAWIGNMTGVDYVESVEINAGGVGVDFTMTGAAPLPLAGTMSGSVD